MIQKLICVFFFVNSFYGYTQSLVKKSILNERISSLYINGSHCFLVEIATTDSKEVLVNAAIEGEYKKELIVTLKEDSSSLYISAGFQPLFNKPNDKLSAHKVVSIVLKISIPKDLDVSFVGKSCNFIGSGKYKNLSISLKDGQCKLIHTSGNVNVETQSGDILVQKATGAFILKSKYGKVQKDLNSKGKSNFTLTTNTGNIQVKKMN